MTISPEPADATLLSAKHIGALAPVWIRQPEGTFTLTPASLTSARAIAEHTSTLSGTGLDWGCGSGLLAIVAAKIQDVERVIGIDLNESNVTAAVVNAALNGVEAKTDFVHADSYLVIDSRDQSVIQGLKGTLDFIVGNPPGSHGHDGLDLRRAMLAGAHDFLKPGGVALVQISSHYRRERMEALAEEVRGISFNGTVATTDWMPFDLERGEFRELLDVYARAEAAGALAYQFGDPHTNGESFVSASAALAMYRESGTCPLTRWQVHKYVRR